MKIIDKVIDRRDAVVNGGSGSPATLEIQNKAIAAILGGLNSTAFETYMQQFANNSDQLNRLTAKDATAGDEVMDRRRAYIVGNFLCGFPTGPTTAREVATIDLDLPPDEQTDAPGCDPTEPRVV